MNYLVQTVNGQIVHDFTFALERSQEYFAWLGNKYSIRHQEGFDFSKVKRPDNYTPVGTVEFVSAYLRAFYPEAEAALIPLNVPEQLFPFAGREIVNAKSVDDLKPFTKEWSVFSKSLTTIKSPDNGIKSVFGDKFNGLVGTQVSSLIDFVSEWRVFVFNGKILDCRNYQGDHFTYPNPDTIKEMVKTYTNAPKVYTLDVGVTVDNKTVVVECHRFFSCGLYGFNQIHLYPVMLSQEWYEMKQIR